MAWPASAPSWDILNALMYGAYRQRLAYNVNLFNGATRGGLMLSSGPAIQGDYEKMSFWKGLSGLVLDRDILSTSALSTVQLEMDNIARTKYAKGTPSVLIPPHQYEWILKSPEEAMAEVAFNLAEQTLADNLNIAATSLIAANANVGASLTYDGTAGTASLTGLTNAAQLWGDRSSNIACWLMHSKVFTDLQLAGLANATQLFKIGDLALMQDQFGRPFIVSDLPALTYTVAGPATRYRVLGLSAGAVKIEAGNDFRSLFETKGGKVNIETYWQAQWTNNIELKGYSWNTAIANPTTAQLGTGTNWTKKAVSVKDMGAILANFQ